MTIESKYSYAIESWLDEATKGLCDAARERIRVETEAHYLDACEAGVAQGLDEEAAHYQALFSLGTAQAARKRFRQVHLTEKDLYLLNGAEPARPAFSRTLFVTFMVLLAVSTTLWIVSGFSMASLGNVSMNLIMLLIMAFEYLKNYVYKKKQGKSVFFWGMVGLISIMNCLLIVINGAMLYESLRDGVPVDFVDVGLSLCGVVLWILINITYIPLLLKLNRLRINDNDLRFRR